MSSFLNRVRCVTATTGQGTAAFGAAFSAAFCTPDEAGAVNGATYTYLLEEGNDFEIGRGVYTTSGATITRATVLISKIGGVVGTTKMTLAGAATIRLIEAAEDLEHVGVTTIDFGAFPGSATASKTITGQTAILSTSAVSAWVQPAATADHTAGEHLRRPPNLVCGAIVAGTGFTIYAQSPDGGLRWGLYNIGWSWQ